MTLTSKPLISVSVNLCKQTRARLQRFLDSLDTAAGVLLDAHDVLLQFVYSMERSETENALLVETELQNRFAVRSVTSNLSTNPAIVSNRHLREAFIETDSKVCILLVTHILLHRLSLKRLFEFHLENPDSLISGNLLGDERSEIESANEDTFERARGGMLLIPSSLYAANGGFDCTLKDDASTAYARKAKSKAFGVKSCNSSYFAVASGSGKHVIASVAR